ncbi:MAG TPA: hypothetical protein VGF30_12365 [Bacteroidia bacterium]
MNETKKAAFEFVKFNISEFSFNETHGQTDSLAISFNPSGVYNESEAEFYLTLGFTAFEGETNKVEKIKAKMNVTFKFDKGTSFQEIPTFFYRNSIAIVFPYLRSFISTLTLQANLKLVILPVLNLTELEQQFRDNTKVEH